MEKLPKAVIENIADFLVRKRYRPRDFLLYHINIMREILLSGNIEDPRNRLHNLLWEIPILFEYLMENKVRMNWKYISMWSNKKAMEIIREYIRDPESDREYMHYTALLPEVKNYQELLSVIEESNRSPSASEESYMYPNTIPEVGEDTLFPEMNEIYREPLIDELRNNLILRALIIADEDAHYRQFDYLEEFSSDEEMDEFAHPLMMEEQHYINIPPLHAEDLPFLPEINELDAPIFQELDGWRNTYIDPTRGEADTNFLFWCNLSANPAAIDILAENTDKINWFRISNNHAAIEIIRNNMTEMYNYLYAAHLRNIAETLPKKYNLRLQGNLLNLFEHHLVTAFSDEKSYRHTKNPEIIEGEINTLSRKDLSDICANPHAIPMLERHQDKIIWEVLASNEAAGELLAKNLDKLKNWRNISRNPGAIKILENNIDKICWSSIHLNPAAYHLLDQFPHKVHLFHDFIHEKLYVLDHARRQYFIDNFVSFMLKVF